MLLENDTIRLRAIEPEDLELLYAWENDTMVWDAGNARQPYSKFLLKQYISESHRDIYESKQLRLMVEEKSLQAAIGTVDLYDFEIHHGRIALGLYINPAWQGNGYGTQCLNLIEEYVFCYLKINQLYVHIARQNMASIALFEKENYLNTAVLGNWIKTTDGYQDIVVFQQLRERYLSSKCK